MRFGKWYKGQTPAAPPTGAPGTLTVAQVNTVNGAGVCYGYVNNMRYGDDAGPQGDIGGVYFYRDVRTVPVVTIKLVGLLNQTGLFVIGIEPSEIPPDDSMPLYTDKLMVDDVLYDFTGAAAAGAYPPTQARYIGTAPSDWLVGSIHTIEFVL